MLSHQKKAAFWRELVELFPNIIDYLCNPNVNPVRHKIKISRFRVQACVASATLLTDGTGWMLRARFRARVSTFGFWFALVALLSRRSICSKLWTSMLCRPPYIDRTPTFHATPM